ncbi:MAG: SDR family NAD(P)-dependent oxidoreductase [Alphaproteobacteria bacterium]|nr:SDR family NAD(P)-dependent oxidoreductase [Alphaproteobacteria bacterium]
MTGLISLVTGATSDIGTAISHALADDGIHVVASGRNHDKLIHVMAGREGKIETISADLTDPKGIETTVKPITSRFKRLDVLILGSGIYERSSDPDTFMRQFTANVHGPYALLQAVLPQLIGAKGLVVFINSTQGLAASPGVGQFAATQHAMRALADSLRAEVDPHGVRVTTIFLGRTATARQEAIFAMERRPYYPERLIQPRDVADLVISLVKLPRTSEIMEIRMRPQLKSY